MRYMLRQMIMHESCDPPAPRQWPKKRATQGDPFPGGGQTPGYFSFAALRNASALSVFSHENAVNALPLASFIAYGVRPKWP